MNTQEKFGLLVFIFFISFILFILTASSEKISNFCIICFLTSLVSFCAIIILGLIEAVKFIKQKRSQIETTPKSNTITLQPSSTKNNENNKPLNPLYAQIDTNKDSGRIRRAKYENFTINTLDFENKKAIILNKERSKRYQTTLTSCTCKDFLERRKPCKHMIRLAGLTGDFPLYKDNEYGVIQRLQVLEGEHQLISKLIDVFYRIRDHKNKYYLKATPNLKALKELNLISLNELSPAEMVDYKYNANELKGILIDRKEFKKSSSKKQLIELFISDDKLVKKLPKNIYHITLNFNETETQYLPDCLNYMLYGN